MLAEMDDQMRLKALIQQRIDGFLAEQRFAAAAIGEDLTPVLDEADAFLRGGKRFRAFGLLLGYTSARRLTLDTPSEERDRVVTAAAALELFHAAALVHDDIIDQSATRRGRTSVHRRFAELHRANQWAGSSSHFGASVGILLGDLLQFWADELFQTALDGMTDPEARQRARVTFNRMRTEVSYGQFFDTLEEQQREFASHDLQLERSTRVLLYKTAKYSVEAPLLIGASLAGAGDTQLDALSAYGIPAGVAFQLRDDVLGVFGDPEVTGKPSGDDLIHGKRTVLVTLARDPLPLTQQRLFDDMLGSDLQPDQIDVLQRTIRDSGALERVEGMIERNVRHATAAAERIGGASGQQLAELAQQLGYRNT